CQGQGDSHPAPLPPGQVADRDRVRATGPADTQIQSLRRGRVRRLEPQLSPRDLTERLARQLDDPPFGLSHQVEVDTLGAEQAGEPVMQGVVPPRSSEPPLRVFPLPLLAGEFGQPVTGCIPDLLSLPYGSFGRRDFRLDFRRRSAGVGWHLFLDLSL